MRGLLVVLAVLALAGCSATAAAKKTVEAQTVAGNWRVHCTDDQFKSERTCYAGTFGETRHTFKFFQIAYVNRTGPIVLTPHDFPGRVATVRVDDGPVLTDPAAIVNALKSGTTAYVVFHIWPTGEERMTLPVAGFAEAYAALLAKVN